MPAAFFVAAAENGEEMEKFFKKSIDKQGLGIYYYQGVSGG